MSDTTKPFDVKTEHDKPQGNAAQEDLYRAQIGLARLAASRGPVDPDLVRKLADALEEQGVQAQALMFALEELAAFPSLAKGFLMWKDGKVYEVAPHKVEGVWRELLKHVELKLPGARRAMDCYYAISTLIPVVESPQELLGRYIEIRDAALELLDECRPMTSDGIERMRRAISAVVP